LNGNLPHGKEWFNNFPWHLLSFMLFSLVLEVYYENVWRKWFGNS
jgi:hypothetical protein